MNQRWFNTRNEGERYEQYNCTITRKTQQANPEAGDRLCNCSLGPGHTLLPFRYGAFEIAKAEGVAILPCALLFEPLAPIAWHKSTETLPMMAWKLAALRHGLRAQLIPLSVIQLTPESDIPQIAEQTRQALQAVVSAGLVER